MKRVDWAYVLFLEPVRINLAVGPLPASPPELSNSEKIIRF